MARNIQERFELLLKAKPDLTVDQLAVIAQIEELYRQAPEDISRFRALYRHLDPAIIDDPSEGITFLKIVGSNESDDLLKERLNGYINTKFNYVGRYRYYEHNMKKFGDYAALVTQSVEDLLNLAGLPQPIIATLREEPAVRQSTGFFELLSLYKESASKRTRFEILRKIGLIVLLARIARHYLFDEIEIATEDVLAVFFDGLVAKRKPEESYFFWVDCDGKLQLSDDRQEASRQFKLDQERRTNLPIRSSSMQEFRCSPYEMAAGGRFLHFEIRNKFMRDGKLSYTSVLEKIVRKNLQYPKEVQDIIAVRIVVAQEEEIPRLIANLEHFLGGSSTRKEEKRSLHKFGQRRLSDFSSSEFSVWKAIYDIALPHPSIDPVEKLMALTQENQAAQRELNDRLVYFLDNPKDFVVEVQLQDLSSYLSGIATGSSASHAQLKMNQIRLNSFFKFFPQEIYASELRSLRDQILAS
jgi:hypothetical protein